MPHHTQWPHVVKVESLRMKSSEEPANEAEKNLQRKVKDEKTKTNNWKILVSQRTK